MKKFIYSVLFSLIMSPGFIYLMNFKPESSKTKIRKEERDKKIRDIKKMIDLEQKYEKELHDLERFISSDVKKK